jgi:hypothetical protein
VLIESVQEMDEQTLDSTEVWPGREARPAWQSLVGVAYTHPLTHVATYQAERGRGERTLLLWQQAVEVLGALDQGDDWQGLMHYNSACILALARRSDQAVHELRQALQLRPALTEWSKQDGDLQALRERDDFQALYRH